MSEAQKTLEELAREVPPDLEPRVRECIEMLLARRAQHPAEPEPPAPGPDATVSLREVTAETVRAICRLSDTLMPPKKYMVAPNAVSIAQAHFEPHAWFRAVYADETPVGFLMLWDGADEENYFLWRLMVAEPHHGKGYGRRAIGLLVDYVKTRPGARALETSCGQGPGNPEGFYRKLGFERSGKMFDDEVGQILVF